MIKRLEQIGLILEPSACLTDDLQDDCFRAFSIFVHNFTLRAKNKPLPIGAATLKNRSPADATRIA
jgi:hypothetical protein